MKAAKSIGILSLSDIANDPRVRRQGDALHQAGWKVFGVGLPGQFAAPPAWPVLTGQPPCAGSIDGVDAPPDPLSSPADFPRDVQQPIQTSLIRRSMLKVRRLVETPIVLSHPQYAEVVYWRWPGPNTLYRSCRALRVDLWLANDWITLPLAARLAKECGGVYVYDSHELACDEFAEQLRWRLFRKPVVAALERAGIQGARHVSVVSEGIATALQNRYQLVHRPLVLRNMPNYQPGTFRKVGTPIGVLYHGVLMPNRGLEATIQSVRRWRGEFTLTLRGPGQTGYRQRLVRLVRKLGLENRVVFASPVPMTELVREAGRFDVGLFALPGHSRHNRYALPNKFFEYVMAGLALCVTELPEMSALLKKYDLGVCMLDARPDTIAATINALTAASIEAYKRNALSAARELNWDRESQKLISAYEAVISGSRQTGV